MLRNKYFIVLIIFACYSCKNDSFVIQDSASTWFDSVVKQANFIGEVNGNKAAFNFIDSVHSANKFSLTDEILYYFYSDYIYKNEYRNYSRCIAIADTVLRLVGNNKSKAFIGFCISAYSNKGNAYMEMGDYTKAFECFYRGRKLALENSDTCGYKRYCYNQAMILYKQQKYIEAAAKFYESIYELGKCNETKFDFIYKKQEFLDNIALCYSKAKRYDSALIYFNKTLNFIDELETTNSIIEKRALDAARAIVYGNMAEVFVAKGQIDSAIILLNKSIKINLQKNYINRDAEISQIKLARIYYSNKNYNLFSSVIDNIKAELDSVENAQVEVDMYKLLWQYYSIVDKPVKATDIIRYNRLNDSLNANQTKIMANDLEQRIINLDNQNNLEEYKKNEAHQKYIFLSIIVFVLFFLIITYIIFKSIKTLKNLNRTINTQKEDLEKAIIDLEAKDKDKNRILHSVAHDVMSPINAILSLSEILLKDTGGISEEQKDICLMIADSCRNSLALSRDIIDASYKFGSHNLNKEEIVINNLVKNCADLMGFKAAEKKQKINVIYNNDTIIATIDKEKIWRILNNLISNAIKFSYENSVIDISVFDDGNKIKVSVKDYGKGIPEKNKAIVFDMFTKAKSPGTQGEKPNGLGLSICLNIAKAHNGNIWFESTEGKGTTFFFEFPKN